MLPLPGWDIKIRAEGDHRSLVGLQHCGRHLCPVCHPYHQATRRAKLEARLPEVIAEQSARYLFVTVTARHHLGVRWKDLRRDIHSVTRSLQQTRRWRVTLGHIRSDETTWGKHGHHFHQHWLIAIPENVEPEEWLGWMKGYIESRLLALGRTADWQPGWWQEVPASELVNVARYQTEGIGWELTGAATKKAPWDMPPAAFAEVWESSRGCRWWSTAGCFRIKGDTDEEIEAERQARPGEVIAWVPGIVWTSLSRDTREDLLELIADRTLSREQFLALWSRANIALGGVLGVGPPPGA
jgi:hypothetical protein